MKNPMRPLLASAAFLISMVACNCLGASQVTMDLTGQILKSGSTLLVTSTASIDASPLYYYEISGTVTGTGQLAAITGTGEDLGTLFSQINDTVQPSVSGTVLNISGKLPFTCVNKLTKGSFTIDEIATVFGQARLEAGIKKTGICYGKITNLSFGAIVGSIKVVDTTDYFVFDSGQITIQTVPFGGPPQPDLSFVLPAGILYGSGVLSSDGTGETYEEMLAKGHSHTFSVVLQNMGTATDSFKLTAPAAPADYSQKFIYKGVNVTKKITKEGGLTIANVPGGGVKTLTWNITNNKDTTADDGFTSVLTATSAANSSVDAVGFQVVVP